MVTCESPGSTEPVAVALDATVERPHWFGSLVPPSRLSQLPRLLPRLDIETSRSMYPADAKARQLEGRVRLRIVIDADGYPVRILMAEDPGHGFAEAARTWMFCQRFTPAMVGKDAVATEISILVAFEAE